jgi:deazaflavin-dependent oxidoreductase (nitroreductase family)
MDEIGTALTDQGRVVRLDTRGRTTGVTRRAHLGFVAEPDGILLVAAGDSDADWALNLEAEPRATVTVGDATWAAIAERLEGRDHAAAVTSLILKYGTPAERLGRGPAYRLRPDPARR